MSYKVILKVFSGRENPEWVLPETLLPKILTYLKKAVITSPPKKNFATLGYNGFVIATANREWHIFNTIITSTINRETVYQSDTDCALEIILQKTVPEEFKMFIPNLEEQ